VLLLAGNAFFVGAEFALISARRAQIEPAADAGSRRARSALRVMERITPNMASAQLGITVCSIGLGAVAKPAVEDLVAPPLVAAGLGGALVDTIAFAVALAVVVSLHMVLGEMVPKNIAIATPERSALALGPPLAAVERAIRPVIVVLNGTANAVLRLVRVEPKDEVASSFTSEEVASLLAESHEEGMIDRVERELAMGALAFEEQTVEAVVLPSEEITVVESTVTPAELERATARTGFSRFPVSEGGALIGYLHVKDALGTPDEERDRPIPPEAVRPLARVDVAATLRGALARMQARGTHLAQAIGGDGRTVGIVTLEDVLEELVGEVRDGAQRAIPTSPTGPAR